MINTDARYRAADGAAITDGARLFNYYDCEWVTVRIAGTWADPTSEFHQHWDGWFDTRSESGRAVPLNGERLAGRKPAWMGASS